MIRARIVLTPDIWDDLNARMRAYAPTEHGVFLTATIGRGSTSARLMVERSLDNPDATGFERQSAHALTPSGPQLSAAVGEALADGSSLIFVHSHPDARHPSSLSDLDEETSAQWASTLVPLTGAPFGSLVWTPHGMEGVVYDSDMVRRVATVEVVGQRRRRVLSARPSVDRDQTAIDDRQRRALGELGNHLLRQLSVAVVGAGGTGSVLAEQLARMGVSELLIIDPDRLDTASNLRRVVGSHHDDLTQHRPKAEVVVDHIVGLGLGTKASAIVEDVREDQIALSLLDVDVLVNTTDTHSSRATLNQLAQQYAIPLIDVGAAIGTTQDGISGMPVELRIVLPDGPCLWCLGVLDPKRIRLENLPAQERKRLVAEGYGADVDAPVPSIAALNGMAASMTALALLRLHSPRGVLDEVVIMDGWEWYAQIAATRPPCGMCASWRRHGDRIARLTRS